MASVSIAQGTESRVLREEADLVRLTPRWRDLLEDSGANEPPMSPEWALAWWGEFRRGRTLRAWTLEEGGRLLGLAPICKVSHWYRGLVPFRRVELLGSAEGDGDIVWADYLNLLARRGHEGEVAAAFMDALEAGRLGGWDELVVPHMAGDGPMPELLVGEAKKRGWGGSLVETARSPYIRLPGSWEEYLGQLDRKDRYLVKRSLRDFEAWSGGEAELHVAQDEAGVHEGREVLRRLHHERWGGRGGTFRTPRFLAFHERLMPELLQRGALGLIWLTVRGDAFAAMYTIYQDGKVSFYQCGRSLLVPKHIRPGGVLLYLAIQSAIREGRREFDFLGGEAVYKSQLATANRPLVRLRVVRRGFSTELRERALRGIEAAVKVARPLVRVFGTRSRGS